jgi:hypothetical protein
MFSIYLQAVLCHGAYSVQGLPESMSVERPRWKLSYKRKVSESRHEWESEWEWESYAAYLTRSIWFDDENTRLVG